MSRDANAKYDARAGEIFRGGHRGEPQLQKAPNPTSGASDVTNGQGVRPLGECVAGAHLFLTPDEVVHDLLGLEEIRDSSRWLKRHHAPVAIDTGHAKRYLTAEILRWAADRFAPAGAGREALRALADSQCRTSCPTKINEQQ